MADFSVNSTQLSAPQGAGTAPVQPVQQQAATASVLPIVGQIVDIFSKGLVDTRKEQQDQFKASILKQYAATEQSYQDAMTTGQWSAQQAASYSRANYMKMLANFPQFHQDLTQMRNAIYGGTEISEAQKKLDFERELRQKNITDAQSAGYVFFPGQSEQSIQNNLQAYNQMRAADTAFSQYTKQQAEFRAQNAESRSQLTFEQGQQEYALKQQAISTTNQAMGANLDALQSTSNDLIRAVQSGSMKYEDALIHHQANFNRIRAGLNAIGARNPEVVSGYMQMVNQLDSDYKSMLDPTKVSGVNTQLLKDQIERTLAATKLAMFDSNPVIKRAAAASELFRQSITPDLVSSQPVTQFILSGTSNQPSTALPMIAGTGTVDEKQLYKQLQTGLDNINKSKDPQKATEEANKVLNNALGQMSRLKDGSIDPRVLKDAVAFYSSPQFGKIAVQKGIDAETARNAQDVFTTQYQPAIRSAIVDRLGESLEGGQKVLRDNIRIEWSGTGVKFSNVESPKAIPNAGALKYGQDGLGTRSDVAAKDLNEASQALNQLIKLHAHLEGTMDYKAYWEANKAKLMPGMFMNGVEPGTVKNGYEFKGGDARNPRNWVKVDGSKQ